LKSPCFLGYIGGNFPERQGKSGKEGLNLKHKPLVGISEASRLLGVSEATLRQWTDEGNLKAFVTPGGHRRYSREELREFMSSRENLLGVKDLVGKLEKTAELHREIGSAFMHSSEWYAQMDESHKKHLAMLGRRILDLMINYVANPLKSDEMLADARDIGRSFGDILAGEGVSLPDSVKAFLSHRGPVTRIVTEMLRKKEILGEGILKAVPLMEQVMDSALIALVEAHQQRKSGK
jgi:excisionase family DNA binding protein